MELTEGTLADKYPHEVLIRLLIERCPFWFAIFELVFGLISCALTIIIAFFIGSSMQYYGLETIPFQSFIENGLNTYGILAFVLYMVGGISLYPTEVLK